MFCSAISSGVCLFSGRFAVPGSAGFFFTAGTLIFFSRFTRVACALRRRLVAFALLFRRLCDGSSLQLAEVVVHDDVEDRDDEICDIVGDDDRNESLNMS